MPQIDANQLTTIIVAAITALASTTASIVAILVNNKRFDDINKRLDKIELRLTNLEADYKEFFKDITKIKSKVGIL